MRWELVKAAWGLAVEAFPDKRVYVAAPARIAPAGRMKVIDLADGEKAGEIDYKVDRSGRMVLKAGDKSRELSLPRLSSHSYRVRKEPRSPDEIQHGMAKAASSARKRFKPYEKCRIVDRRSMEFGELGQVLSSASREGRRFYLVSVDGSGTPMWFAEESLAPNMVGAVIYRP